MKSHSMQGVLMVLGAAMLWGTTGTAQSFAPPQLSSYWVGTFRLVFAGMFFFVWAELVDGQQNAVNRMSRDGSDHIIQDRIEHFLLVNGMPALLTFSGLSSTIRTTTSSAEQPKIRATASVALFMKSDFSAIECFPSMGWISIETRLVTSTRCSFRISELYLC